MFTENQLKLIQEVAKKRKNQGEMSVWLNIPTSRFTDEQLIVIRYCAEECERQHSGEMSVHDMVNAWNYAATIDKYVPNTLNISFIEAIGKIVEPIDNRNGFRKVAVGIWDSYVWKEKAPWDRVPFLLELLLESYCDGSLEVENPLAKTREDQFYYEYENIHPFVDGNGRSGKILYAYLTNSLNNPYLPPNFWASTNP